MKKVVFLLSLFLTFSSFANNSSEIEVKSGTIIGKILDTSNKPIPYVTILIKDSSKKSITGGITDDKGSFQINKVPYGDLFVEINFMGFESIIKQIKLTKRTLDLGTFILKESSDVLDEVTVIAETSTVVQKIDRKVINVGKDLIAAGTTASELLNNVQSVSVDSQSGNISLRGNENVRVLVDGKPTNISAAQLLKQIPSTSIKSVELITNPSAKYNPEGMSGIINIVLHKNAMLGFNGSINTGITRGVNTRFNGSVDMNFKTGKVNFFANYGYNDGRNDNFGKVSRHDLSAIQNFNWDFDRTSHLLKFGADVYINDKNTLSVYTIQNRSDSNSSGRTFITDSFLTGLNDTRNEVENSNDGRTYNINYTIEFDKEGESLELEANVSTRTGPELSIFDELVKPYDKTGNYVDNLNNDRGNELYNIDYVNPLSDNSKLELGLEYRKNRTENNYKTTRHEFVYQYDMGELITDGQGNPLREVENIVYEGNTVPWFQTVARDNSEFEYIREIYSAYVNYNQKVGKVSMQLGARLEDFTVTGDFKEGVDQEDYTDHIFTVYPSAFFTYNPNKKNQFQWSYSKRVDRPNIQQVNPIRQWSTPLITSIGNQSLRPQFTNSYEFNYTRNLKKGSITFGTFYREVNDNISRILHVDEFNPDKVELSFSNFDKSDRYGAELSLNYAVKNWWRINASTDLYIQEQVGLSGSESIEVTNNVFNIRVNNSISATKKLRFQLFGMFRGGTDGIQFKVDPMWMVNAGTSLSVLKGKGTVSFRMNDIFKGMKFKFDTQRPIPQFGQFNWESRTAYLGFMYRFGGGKNKAKRRKNRGNDDNGGGGGGFL